MVLDHFLQVWGGVNIINPGSIFIGEKVMIDTLHPELITIEENATITSGTVILTHYIHSDGSYTSGRVHIKKNSFIGVNSVICKNITIGENAIIGAGSIITKDIPDNELWAGNPAKFIKRIHKEK